MTQFRPPSLLEQEILDHLDLKLLESDEDRARFEKMMVSHHYLKSDRLVGEQLRYVAQVHGQWVALLSWSAAAYHLKHREAWVGWNEAQRRRRLALVANNARFLILPGVDCPNLASRALALNAARLSADWESAYGHRILAVESFVDSQLFRGTCYKAQGWSLLGETDGFGRVSQDFYTEHERPKQLWMRELEAGAREKLRAVSLEPSLRSVEEKVVPLPEATASEIRGLVEICRQVPDWRKRKGLDYPLAGLLAFDRAGRPLRGGARPARLGGLCPKPEPGEIALAAVPQRPRRTLSISQGDYFSAGAGERGAGIYRAGPRAVA
jgi:hypothetical protein